MFVEVGVACNNRCIFCGRANKRGNYTTEDLYQIILRAKNQKDDSIFLSGGEPTVRRDFFDSIRFAKNQGFLRIIVQTNSRKLKDKDFLKTLINSGCTEVNTSIHGHTAEIHDKQTRVPGSFDEAVTGIKNTLELGIKVISNTVITRINLPFLPEIASFLIKLGIKKFTFSFPSIVGGALNNFESIVPYYKDLPPALSKIFQILEDHPQVECTFQSIPPCYLKDRIIHSEEVRREDVMSIMTVEGIIKSLDQQMEEELNVKGIECKNCVYEEICLGVEKEYADRRGWDEFKPATYASPQKEDSHMGQLTDLFLKFKDFKFINKTWGGILVENHQAIFVTRMGRNLLACIAKNYNMKKVLEEFGPGAFNFIDSLIKRGYIGLSEKPAMNYNARFNILPVASQKKQEKCKENLYEYQFPGLKQISRK